MSEIHRVAESEIYKAGGDGLVRDLEAEEAAVVWAEQQRQEGLHVVDGELVGRLSEETQQKHSPVVLVGRNAKQNLKRAAGRVGGLFTPG